MKYTEKSISVVITLTVSLLMSLQLRAQNNNPEVKPDIPPSPQAVAFNRLGDYQVNNNYGMPDISIPLFEIDHHGYKIPLTLHYEATPMKPGYNYDVTGFGWTLSGNSCVSRTIKDRADEVGRFNNPFALDAFYDQAGHMKRYMDYADELDNLNFQYDSYNIVLPSGRSIPFYMYKSNGGMHYDLLNLDTHVKIVCSYDTNIIYGFTVTDENGVIYHFTVADKTNNSFDDDVNADRNVTWLLTSIDIPSKGTIYYEYSAIQTVNASVVEEPVVRVSRLASEREEDFNERRLRVIKVPQPQCPRYRMRFLNRIVYGPTQVVFNYNNDHLHMSEIVVSESGQTIKRFTLNMDGYGENTCSSLTSLVISGQNNEERLEYRFSYSSKNPGSYTDFWGNRCNPGPSLLADNGHTINNNGMDDLGYFNMFFGYDGIALGWNELQYQLSHDGILAQLIEKKEDDHDYYWKMKLQTTTGGDTRVPTSPDKHGVLTSITYPNGGSTHFYWENHRFPTATAADGDFVFDRRSQRIIEGGGFRIRIITNYAADGTVASADYYKYGFTLGEIIQEHFPLPLPDFLDISHLSFNDTINQHIGCGEAVVDPNVLTFMTYSHATSIETPLEFQKMIVGLPSRFEHFGNLSGLPSWWDAVFSANTFRSRLGGRRPVVYPEITVYHGDPDQSGNSISKTVYKYDIYSRQLSPDIYYQSALGQTVLPDTAYFEPLYFFSSGMRCMEQPAKRHQLKSKSDYSYDAVTHTWSLTSEEKYYYDEENISKSGYVFDSTVSRGHCGVHTLQLGASRPLEMFTLGEFYQNNTQRIGRSTMTAKHTTTLRPGGTRTGGNTQSEEYSYLYTGVLSSRYYTDIYDKADTYTYTSGAYNPDSVTAAMVARNMLASLTSAESYPCDWPSDVTGSKIGYAFYGNDILPSKLYESKGGQYEESLKVISYDSFGNPTEIVDLKTGNEQTGIHSVYLWDSYGRYLIAMITNARLEQIQNVTQLRTANSQTRYSMLKSLLPNAQVQTWDYLPLTGVSSRTDANGQTTLYEYDGLGRLKSEKRVQNGVSGAEQVQEYEYNYQNQ